MHGRSTHADSAAAAANELPEHDDHVRAFVDHVLDLVLHLVEGLDDRVEELLYAGTAVVAGRVRHRRPLAHVDLGVEMLEDRTNAALVEGLVSSPEPLGIAFRHKREFPRNMDSALAPR